jgi:hypothetical protein
MSIQNGREISIQHGNCLCMKGKSPFGMGLFHEWEISIHGTLDSASAPSGLAGMDGAVASLRHDAIRCDDGRRAASASATRPSSACYSL